MNEKIELIEYIFKHCQKCQNIDYYQIIIPFIFIFIWIVLMFISIIMQIYTIHNYLTIFFQIFYALYTLCLTSIEKIKYVSIKSVKIDYNNILYEITDDNYISIYTFFIKFINRNWFVDFKKIENHDYILYTNIYPINIYNCRIYKLDDILFILYLKHKLKLKNNTFP